MFKYEMGDHKSLHNHGGSHKITKTNRTEIVHTSGHFQKKTKISLKSIHIYRKRHRTR